MAISVSGEDTKTADVSISTMVSVVAPGMVYIEVVEDYDDGVVICLRLTPDTAKRLSQALVYDAEHAKRLAIASCANQRICKCCGQRLED